MVAVGVVAGDAAEFVLCQFGGLLVVRGGVLDGGIAGQRLKVQQRLGGGRAVEVPVGDDCAVVSSLRSAVVRVKVLDQLRAGPLPEDTRGQGQLRD